MIKIVKIYLRINRNIMEFKAVWKRSRKLIGWRINRNIMEFKGNMKKIISAKHIPN